MYAFFPSSEDWSKMEPSSLTVLLEPTNLRVAFLILRKEPPTPCTYLVSWMVYLIFFVVVVVVSLRRLHYHSFLLFTWKEYSCYVCPFWWSFVCLFSVESERTGEGEDVFSNKPHPWFTMRLWWLTASLRCRCFFFSLAFLKEQAPAVRQLQTLRELCSRRAKSS